MLLELLKVPLNILLLASWRIATTPPNPPPRKEEQSRIPDTRSIRIMRATRDAALLSASTIAMGMLIVDTIVAIARCRPQGSRQLLELVCGAKGSEANVTISKTFLCGVAFATAGTWIRMLSFNELGRLFTFDLALRDKHQLVTTGPYAVVRHPAYTGYALLWVGMSMCLFGEGSWWTGADVNKATIGKMLAGAWGVVVLRSFIFVIFGLPHMEERMLRRAFRKEFAEYTHKTPSKYIPGVW